MTDLSEKLSAYLDGELSADDAAEIEARLAQDAAAQAEFDALLEADALAQSGFEAALREPVPLSLAQSIRATPLSMPQEPLPRTGADDRDAAIARGWRYALPLRSGLAAGLAVFVLGGIGGYWLKEVAAPVVMTPTRSVAAGWLSDIADYHAIYASETRHLVEVPAAEADHLRRWLTKTVEVAFAIPDLSAFGLTFEGGRLLVANGAPVGQLMYRRVDGTVIALCLQAGDTPQGEAFATRTMRGFDFISWNGEGGKFVLIGPEGQPGLAAIARAAAQGVAL
ncbi:anti-sigma factor family protein [Phaeobacter gallaeciensis]|uniref:Transmembrane transcriptional regulator (Anti-sigma factor) n=1 Tax=Phaeobacter gallaeciensis TaxID=60890 RepID=A0AAC9ZDF4_9RHOB|nr:anti-sigma factor [Phaeobacter gallaeciensis]AHD11980.1 putative transmembrane transcriptional regulator (anti-sigma factor) [Phaeobacter gallaeciensis DSM 26640]ATE95246.1 putative transmembrane transcriptional regulator (anti-sigma factor) [Phaeobacter gallaeciensis]ATE99637.1 putative transmembrane transcriptional regulator (anti-sigma factor) [Phaeobacter gallaeciensis]ATF03951.1 putative transmembrane transcriptional regulator (anti-sigma factor) [Phaeobacter gallaeciensis]ATF08227.1 p